MQMEMLTFNPFQENMYVLWDKSKECVIIDPGCCNHTEEQALVAFIEKKDLKPVRLLNTHCHLDHILGNAFVAEKWGLELEMHRKDLPTLAIGEASAKMYQIPYMKSPEPAVFLEEGDKITFGHSTLDVLFVPGHAPGHIAFVSHSDKLVIGGDVLFRGSIGRTDLPGGNYEVLEKSIREKLYALEDNYTVVSGHGPSTTIGDEKRSNAFVRG